MLNTSLSTIFILVIFLFDKIWTIQILNFNKWQLQIRFWNLKWFQLQKSWHKSYWTHHYIQLLFWHFFMWQSISKHCSQIHIWLIVLWTIRETCWFVNNVYYHFVRWRNHQNKSCRFWWVIQLWYSLLFQLKSFNGWKSYSNLSFF